jgi:hypothetical protein
MKSYIAVSSITGGPRVKRNAGDNSPPTNVQTIDAGKTFDPAALGIDGAALERMVKRGAVRANAPTDHEESASDPAATGKQ